MKDIGCGVGSQFQFVYKASLVQLKHIGILSGQIYLKYLIIQHEIILHMYKYTCHDLKSNASTDYIGS